MSTEPERVGEVDTIEIVSRETSPPKQAKKPRGLAALSPEKRREIARAGGRAAQAKGTARKFTSAEAREAGRKGGAAHGRAHQAEIGRKGGLSVSADREHMAEIGRRGGAAVSADRKHMAEIGKKGGESAGKGSDE